MILCVKNNSQSPHKHLNENTCRQAGSENRLSKNQCNPWQKKIRFLPAGRQACHSMPKVTRKTMNTVSYNTPDKHPK